MNFESASKFVIFFFVRLILIKMRFNGCTGPRRKIEDRYEFGLKVSLGFRVQIEIIAAIFQPFLKQQVNLKFFL